MTDDYEYLFESKKSLYIHGVTYSGKTSTVLNFMKKHNKDYTYVSIQDLKNEQDFLSLLMCQNVLMMFHQQNQPKNKFIIIDNIDILQNSDKKMINYFIKFFKTKKHLDYKHVSYIFIGSNDEDKKLNQLQGYLDHVIHMSGEGYVKQDLSIKDTVWEFIKKKHEYISELRDKNIIALCFHENTIYHMNNNSHTYYDILRLFCKGDYYDRMSFKKQLWQFNEMTFYLKVVLNQIKLIPDANKEIIFTKILTKFSNQYSNLTFINKMCLYTNKQKEEVYHMLKNEDEHYFSNQEHTRLTKLML